MAFKHVPDYWSFQSMVDADLFRWRAELEQRLDELHDRTAEIMFEGRASVQEDVQRHRAWSESLKSAQMSPEEVADLTHMLSLRGVLPQPGYTDKPVRRMAAWLAKQVVAGPSVRPCAVPPRRRPACRMWEMGPGSRSVMQAVCRLTKMRITPSCTKKRSWKRQVLRHTWKTGLLEDARRRAQEIAADFYDDEGYFDDS